MGASICQYLSERRQPFVVIDRDEKHLRATCDPKGWLYEIGDATSDADLRRAGIYQARSLATVLPTDADNIYVVLSARLLSAKIQIVARASDECAIDKMQRAGATRVISPFSSGAQKMARFMLSPASRTFWRSPTNAAANWSWPMSRSERPALRRQEAGRDRPAGKGGHGDRIRRANGEKLLPPPGTAVIQAGDSLFAFGSSQAVNAMIGGEAL